MAFMDTASFEKITQEQIDLEEARTKEEERLYRGIRAPEITAGFGNLGPHEFEEYPDGPSRDELEDAALADAAMAVDDPWSEL